ncbi:DUF4197 domain-containing protein [Paracrocinitomix mangrovi]|uniref:DUF4197 domain-containing protein n=1 Tax=Paracrocinitomix mangrovi TaxID=2862509 RepID=UPI001C8D6711|nr:DUF4197 domain-containing protein [Paracrocinitomix mangrovi]UKN01716.1 DUF4197 domain-containing protein [Paracrocinitomix mangrovi]
MKKLKIFLGVFLALSLTQCDVLEDVAGSVTSGSGTGDEGNKLTNDEVIAGLKEALKIGIDKGATKASALDGFYKNPKIFIPWPEDAQKVKDWAIDKGMDGKVNEIEEKFNRAAETASAKAKPIFVNAITGMTVSDGFAILNGSDTAATHYLRKTTWSPLKGEFKPVVHDAVESVEVMKYWEPVANGYNKIAKITGKDEVNTDIDEYVTNKGMNGLFYLISEQEKKIRLDPVAQVTDLLKKVFGSVMNN